MGVVNREDKRQAALFASEPDGGFAGVVLNRPVDAVLSYRVPKRLEGRVQIGTRLSVPLGKGNQPAVGYCVSLDAEQPAGVDLGRVKDVLDVLDDPPLIDAAMLELTRWMGQYYACSWGQALDAVVPAGVRKGAGTQLKVCLVVPDETKMARDTLKLPTKQAEVLALLCRSEALLTVADVCRMARCKTGPIAALRAAGLIRAVKRRMSRIVEPAAAEPAEVRAPLLPTEEQRIALDRLEPSLQGDAFSAFVIHGVTGSGKTELYLSAIESVVARGREAIVLVPEISLTPQTIRRFRRRFSKVAVLHSHLSDAERHRHWRCIAAGEIQVVVGARSAVFAPTRKLGLIVIDEEHETTFKQETTPRYHARDVAVKRAQLEKIPIILGSATPSLESWRNTELGRYTRLSLTSRVASRPMPAVELIDLRTEKPTRGSSIGGLSAPLKLAMREALDDGGQILLLLNRRGFHTFILCPSCGSVLKCHACDVALTHHKGRDRAICHTCDAERDPPKQCTSCGATSLHYGGIGTERLEREVRAAFPDKVVRRMDSDTMRSPGSHEQVLNLFKEGQVDILLGTQMIAKGLDFPNVTLVGVVSADTALHLPDFRAAERTFQLVAQVAGRTGRGDRPGKVLVQTFSPENPAILRAARHDYLGFVQDEMPMRQVHGTPPFGRVARLIARGPVEQAVQEFMEALSTALKASANGSVTLLGPAPAPVTKIRDLFRYHIQIRAPSAKSIQSVLRAVIPETNPPGDVELAVDVDPVNLL
jgi:primosomal protein N' (replication factor Y) (superfamily II helicase)